MLQIALVLVAIGLIVLGIKGFTEAGIPISKTTTLKGKSGKIAGVACILGGLLLIPAFMVFVGALSWATGR